MAVDEATRRTRRSYPLNPRMADDEARVLAAEEFGARAAAELTAARAELAAAQAEAAAASATRASLEAEARALEDEIAALSRDDDAARAASERDAAARAAETRELEASIASTEAENAARRADIAERLRETQSATAATTAVVASLRAQAAARAALVEEVARLRARLHEKRALGLHNELVAITRATRVAAGTAAERLDALKQTRTSQVAELRSLGAELEALRRDVAAELAEKERADAALSSVDAAFHHASAASSSTPERARMLAGRPTT